MRRHTTILSPLAVALLILVSSCGRSFEETVGAKLPAIAGAKALSRHYIEVTFSEPVGEEAEDPNTYLITTPDSSRLPVRAANRSQDRIRVLLTTDAQQHVDAYTLTIQDIMELGGGVGTAIQPAPMDGRPEPELDTAVALDANTVLLTLSERMDRPSTENTEFYRIYAENTETPRTDVAEVTITNAVLGDGDITVRLTTSDLTNIRYTVKMTNAVRGPGPFLIDPDHNTQKFFGIRPDDFVPPRLVKAEATSSTSVLLSFSEPLRDEADAFSDPLRDESDDAGNFSISPTLVVTDAKLTKHNTQILLTTLTQIPDRLYTVTVANVKDIAGNVIKSGTVCIDNGEDCATDADCSVNMDCVASDTAEFRGSSRELFVHGAMSLGNTEVLVTFSEPMDPGTTACANRAACRAIYSISDPDGDTDVDIIVESGVPDLPDPGDPDVRKRTVVLTTTPQENIQYTLTVRNVRSIQDDFLLDPTRNTATFMGIPAEDSLGPHVSDAVAISNTSVLVSFSEPLGGTGILDSRPDGEPDDPTNFRITLSACTKDHCDQGASQGDPCAPGDACPPNLAFCTRGQCTDGVNKDNQCTQDSDCPMDDTGTCNLQTLPDCEELVIEDGELTVHDTQVLLTTLAQVVNVKYTATASNVKDKSGNDLVLPDSGDFRGVPRTDTGPPRVIGAISTSNVTVVVTFSKRMGLSAVDPANYSIVQENVLPEAAAVAVVSARFVNEEVGDAVQLTTLPQSDVTYRVIAVNVVDAQGNQLAPQELFVDPTSAVFAGTAFGCPSLRFCTNGPDGPDSGPFCFDDNDCDDDPQAPCRRGEDCQGACVQPPAPCTEPDSDGDGLADDEEQRGWIVRVVLADGSVTEREVTSDPLVADTDADGVTDLIEKRSAIDPRDADTDDDTIPDLDERVLHYSSPRKVDSDGDGLPDYRELNLFQTSLILADTDGDDFSDFEEVIQLNRDPCVADFPRPRIQIGDVALRLDTRFRYTDRQGASRTSQESFATTLQKSEETSFSFTDTSTTKLGATVEASATAKITAAGTFGGGSVGGKIGFSFAQEFQSQVTQASKRASQETYNRSLSTSETVDEVHEVTRDVVGASVEVALTISNIGDIAFTMTNLEVTALLQDPVNRSRFIPVATLVPASQLITGEIPSITAGLFVPERGPFIFKSRDVFPSLVEDLMKNPRGLIFEVANFDVLDEFGRNFAFIEQSINERTAGLTIDFGNSRVERYRLATYNSFHDVVRACDNSTPTTEGRECKFDSDCADLCEEGTCGGAGKCSNNNSLACTVDADCEKRCSGDPSVVCVGHASCAGSGGRCARALCDDGNTSTDGAACRVDADCAPDGRCREDLLHSVFSGAFDENGKTRGIRLKSALQGILGIQENASPNAITVGPNGCGETWAWGDDIQVFAPICFDVIRDDRVIILPGPNGVLNAAPQGDDIEVQMEVGQCSSNPDLQCTAHSDCADNECEFVACVPGACDVVPDSCAPDPCMGGSCSGIFCLSGPRTSEPCVDDSDCGECPDGTSCTSDADCDFSCMSGPSLGASCASDEECGRCDTGPRLDAACTEDLDCGECVGGPNDASCTNDYQCGGQCDGGSMDGQGCKTDLDPE